LHQELLSEVPASGNLKYCKRGKKRDPAKQQH